MVTFRCVNKVNNKTTYKYFPEADEKKRADTKLFNMILKILTDENRLKKTNHQLEGARIILLSLLWGATDIMTAAVGG